MVVPEYGAKIEFRINYAGFYPIHLFWFTYNGTIVKQKLYAFGYSYLLKFAKPGSAFSHV